MWCCIKYIGASLEDTEVMINVENSATYYSPLFFQHCYSVWRHETNFQANCEPVLTLNSL